MRNIKLTLEYDGSRFFGFQRQKDRPTIQGELEKVLSKLFNRLMKISAAAGRTDTGVHAKAQVVNFKTDSKLPLKKIQKGLNALLPKEIAVTRVDETRPDFHARYDAQWKSYEYCVLNSPVRSPLLNGRAYQFPYRLNLLKMRKAAREFLGRHDFQAFQASNSSVKNSIRRVRRFTIERRRKLLRFQIEADGFLYHMIRRIVGVLLELGRGSLSLQDLRDLLRRRQSFHTGPTVPGHGLTLVSVEYGARVAMRRRF